MNSMSIATLNDLIKEKRAKKKKAPTTQERKQFRDAWIELATNEGFTERVEQYLYEGFFFCGAEPFKSYLSQTKEPNEVLESLFAGKLYGADMSVIFRLLSHLLALLLNDNVPQNILVPIIKRLPGVSVNKEKKRLCSAEKTMEKYFFAELDRDVQLIPLNDLGTKPIFIAEFIAMMSSVIEGIKQIASPKSEVAINIAKVQAWISAYPKNFGEHTDGKAETNKSWSQVVHNHQIPMPTSSSCPSLINTEKIPEPMDMNAHFMDLINQVSETASAIRAESIQQKNQVVALTCSLKNEKKKLHHANRQTTEQLEVIADLRQNLATKETDLLSLRQTISQRDATIADKEAEIAERIKMSDVLSRDRTKQADEVLQRMASKIRVEYRDFQDAIATPMNCDLGENLRLQLQNIFDTLEKGGMKIK